MALSISRQVNGQTASSTLTYCYLAEPLKVYITDSDADTRIIYADVTKIGTDDGVVVSTDVAYIYRDVSSNGGVVIDLTKVMGQMHDYDTLRYANVNDIVNGWESVVSKYIYKFEFYTDQSTVKTEVKKLPIIGGRSFENFLGLVNHDTKLRELTNSEIVATGKIGDYKDIVFSLKQISTVTDDDYRPTGVLSAQSNSPTSPCEGVIYWKSKLGGWMMMGVDIKSETKSHSYSGNLSNGMFESTSYTGGISGGKVYVPTNYMSTSSQLTLNLKTITLDADVLKAVSEIAGSPAVYYQRRYNSAGAGTVSSLAPIELMRMTSFSAPIKTHIGGGDFTVTLSRISSTEYKTK